MKWFSENLIFFDDFQINEEMLEMVNQPDIKNAIIEFFQFSDFNIEDVTGGEGCCTADAARV